MAAKKRPGQQIAKRYPPYLLARQIAALKKLSDDTETPVQYLDLHAGGVVLPDAFVRPSSRRAIGWCGFHWVEGVTRWSGTSADSEPASRRQLGRLVESFGLQPFVDFFAVYRHAGGRSEAEADLTALNAEDSYGHLVAYIHGLSWTPAENQHSDLPVFQRAPSWSLPRVYVYAENLYAHIK